MFEALFILTTIAAGTRVGRYILQDFLGHLWKPLADTDKLGPNLLACALMTGAWGYFLIQGVRDPLGGINSLWPLFGIANQMLAAIGLCLATTIILKMQLGRDGVSPSQNQEVGRQNAVPPGKGRPILALVTLVPLVWLLAVTFTAGAEKIWHPDPRIGFLAQAKILKEKIDWAEGPLEILMPSDQAAIVKRDYKAAKADLPKNCTLYFNNLLDAVVTFTFLVLVFIIVVISVREWLLLLGRRKLAELRESDPVWLPDYAVAEGRPVKLLGLLALSLALAKELSGEAQFERARQQACICVKHDAKIYTKVTEERFNGVRRCC
jgi:carbon starvation protein